MKVFENGEETTRADADGLDRSVELVCLEDRTGLFERL